MPVLRSGILRRVDRFQVEGAARAKSGSALWPNSDFGWLFAQFGLSARAVPVAQNFHAAFLRLGAVEDDVRWGGQLAHAGAFRV